MPLRWTAALRVGASAAEARATDGSTGLIGLIDELFVYGAALTTGELDYIYRAAQVSTLAGTIM